MKLRSSECAVHSYDFLIDYGNKNLNVFAKIVEDRDTKNIPVY